MAAVDDMIGDLSGASVQMVQKMEATQKIWDGSASISVSWSQGQHGLEIAGKPIDGPRLELPIPPDRS